MSDTGTAFAQNEKDYKKWHNDITENKFSLVNGHKLTDQELSKRKKILEVMCEFKTHLEDHELTEIQKSKMDGLIGDQLVSKDGTLYRVTPLGKYFVRNICAAIDDLL